MNSATQNQPVALFAMSRRAPMVLAVLALLGVAAEAGVQLNRASAARSVPTAPTVQMVSAMLSEPAYHVLAESMDWSKVEVSAIAPGASVAAYER